MGSNTEATPVGEEELAYLRRIPC